MIWIWTRFQDLSGTSSLAWKRTLLQRKGAKSCKAVNLRRLLSAFADFALFAFKSSPPKQPYN